MTSQRYLVLSKHPIYGVRTGHYVYLTDEEGRRKTETGHVVPAPPPKPDPDPEPEPKPRRARRTAKAAPEVTPPESSGASEPAERTTGYRSDPSPS